MPDPSSAAVHVADLRKIFSVPVREAGLVAAAKSLVKRESREIKAVDGVGFDIEPGEVVGFLGPNGAGKTTTLKMLSGLLYPTSGEALVLGHVPSKREREFLRRITMVMGNRNQLQWDLPALDSFELIRAIYRLPADDFTKTRDEFIELLELGPLVNKPVRNLSLGERMKMEFVAALLHRPVVLFLDEPTLGLDITMQKRIRSFVAEYNRRYGATVLLTSHYMADVQALCKRVIVIHHGRMLFDGALTELASRFNATKTIGVLLRDGDRRPVGLRRGHGVRGRPRAASGRPRRCARRRDAAPARPAGRRPDDRGSADRRRHRERLRDRATGRWHGGRGTHGSRLVVTAVASPAPRRGPIAWARGWFDIYTTSMRIAVVTQFQYRVANYFYMIGMVAEPVIYLVVWSTVAVQQGGEVGGFTPGEFAAYYIVWTLVRNMNIALTPWAWEERIKQGELSGMLLKPMHPIHFDLAFLAGWKVVVIILWLPLAAFLSLLFNPTFNAGLADIAVFFVAIWGAYVIRSLELWTLGLVTFWTTRVGPVFDVFFTAELLLSGRLVPLALMPDWAQQLANFFPFKWTLRLPDRGADRPAAELRADRRAGDPGAVDRAADGRRRGRLAHCDQALLGGGRLTWRANRSGR